MRVLPTTRTAHDKQPGHAPLALKPCAQVYRHTSIAWQITGALGGRHGSSFTAFFVLSLPVQG